MAKSEWARAGGALVVAGVVVAFGVAGAIWGDGEQVDAGGRGWVVREDGRRSWDRGGAAGRSLTAGWGLDAIVSRHLGADQRPAFVRLLEQTEIHYLRERNHADSRDPAIWETGEFATFRDLGEAGFGVVAFATLPGRPVGEERGNQLHENLLTVYAAARELGRRTGGLVAAWELPNEPDVFFVQDLPDRFAAYSKAVYLGLRDGARSSGVARAREPAVLMGALGHFPGPWLERAAANGLFDYTDGLNIHFYGHARDLPGAIRSQREFARQFTPDRELPVWITECGMNAVPYDDVEEARGREIQRAFTVATAQTALDEGVAVFMPFVMVWGRNPQWSLIRTSGKPYPAWNAYTDFTRRHQLAAGSAVARPASPNRLVVQWLPDNATCIPHKIGGTYWFRGSSVDPKPIHGHWVITNLSGQAVPGTFDLAVPVGLTVEMNGVETRGVSVIVSAFSRVRIPATVSIPAEGAGYLRERVTGTFRPLRSGDGMGATRAVVGFETRPTRVNLPGRTELTGARPPLDRFSWLWAPEPFVDPTEAGAWLGVNGVVVEGDVDATSASLSRRTSTFLVRGEQSNPRLPPMAITQVNGLPGGIDGFLRLRDLGQGKLAGAIRVDLVDADGQRFAIAEGLGRNPKKSSSDEVFLALKDFHPYAFGRLTNQPVFRPEAVREIHLRFHPRQENVRFRLRLDVARSGSAKK